VWCNEKAALALRAVLVNEAAREAARHTTQKLVKCVISVCCSLSVKSGGLSLSFQLLK